MQNMFRSGILIEGCDATENFRVYDDERKKVKSSSETLTSELRTTEFYCESHCWVHLYIDFEHRRVNGLSNFEKSIPVENENF